MEFSKTPMVARLSKLWGCLADCLLGRTESDGPNVWANCPPGVRLVVYPVIVREARRRGIGMAAIAACIGISVEALHDKLCGRSPLFLHEVCAVRAESFPDIELEALVWRNGV